MLNANAIRNNYPLRTVTLTVPSVTLAQLFVQSTATQFITLDVTINPFVTDIMAEDSFVFAGAFVYLVPLFPRCSEGSL